MPVDVDIRTSRLPAYRREPEEKCDRIAASAGRLFAERGYAGTTTAEIARRAGVSEGILFHHFGSKRDLFAGVAGDYGRGLARAMFGDDPEGSLVAPDLAIRRAFAYVRANRSFHRLLRDGGSELSELAHARTRAEIVGALEAVFRSGVERGALRGRDPRITAELLYSLVEGGLEACFVEGDGARESDYLRETIACARGALASIERL